MWKARPSSFVLNWSMVAFAVSQHLWHIKVRVNSLLINSS